MFLYISVLIGDKDQNFPCEVSLKEPMTRVACGSGHTMVLSKNGNVFTWGQSSHGQLGLGMDCMFQIQFALKGQSEVMKNDNF